MRRSLARVGVIIVVALLTAGAPAASAAVAASASGGEGATAQPAVELSPALVRAAAGDQFTAYSAKVDANGTSHVRYTRTHHGLRVYGGDVVVHSAPGGAVLGASNALAAPLSLATTATVPASIAARTARAHFEGAITSVGGSELVIDASAGAGRLAWETTVSGWAPDGQTPSVLHVLTDAAKGAFIGAWDEIETILPAGEGRTLYSGTVALDTTNLGGGSWSMVDPVRGNGSTCDMLNGTSTCTVFTDADNVWGNFTNSSRQTAAADAHYGAALTYDYYRIVHGRTGIFGNGAGVPSRVHYGQNYVNAFWDGSKMTYGDGAGNAKPLVSIDVAGHEMSHGVTENVVPGGLTYAGESGGLNEATSDIFGTMVEFFANNATDPGDYKIGEKININGNGTPLRYMYNPGLDGASHTCWSTSTNGVDVHYSSGVGNHFFFNLAEGTGATSYGTSPLCGSAPAMTGIGRAKAEKIWYRALDVYFTSTTRYVNSANPANTARAYTLQAATDLYGFCGTEYKAVQAAWKAVNVAGSDAVCPLPLSLYINGPGNITVKGSYTFTAVYSGFNANPGFTWSERFCSDAASTSCSNWATITGLGATFQRVLGPDCSGTQENSFQLRLVMHNSDGRDATAYHTSWLCGPA